MAKYDITYTCGHDGVIELFGKNKDREYWFSQKQSGICPQCQDDQNKSSATDIAAKAVADGFVTLRGSEKQIIWAEQIRATKYREIQDRETKELSIMQDEAYKARYIEVIGYIYQTFKAVNNASWWIEHRNHDTDGIIQGLRELVRAAKM